MSTPGSVRVTVVVAVPPDEAFAVFTQETAAWFRSRITRPGGGHLRFDEAGRRVLHAGGEGDGEVGGEGEIGRAHV